MTISDGDIRMLMALVDERLRNPRHAAGDHRDGGMVPQKLRPGAASDVMVTDATRRRVTWSNPVLAGIVTQSLLDGALSEYAPMGHLHDDRYVTQVAQRTFEALVANALDEYAPMGHLHDDRYPRLPQMFAEQASRARLRDYIESLGPVGYWRLGDATGNNGVAVDEMGSHAGTWGSTGGAAQGQASLVDGDGDASGYFDNGNDTITVPYSAALNAASFSVVAIVKPDADPGTNNYRLIAGSYVSNAGWYFTIDTSNKLRLGIGTGSTNSSVASVTTLTAGQTFAVAGTYDSTTGYRRVYVDGKPDAGTVAIAMSANASHALEIGAGQPASQPLYGYADEVAYFDRVLTHDEIAEIARLQKSVIDAYTDTSDNDTDYSARITSGNDYYSAVMACSPIGYWRCDDASGGILKDRSSNELDFYGLNGSGHATCGVTGALGGDSNLAITLTAASSQALCRPGFDSALNPAAMTVAAWVKTSTAATQIIFDNRDGSGAGKKGAVVYIGGASYKIYAQNGVGTQVIGTTSLNDGLWHFVVVNFDGSNAYVYVDGCLENSGACTLTPNATATAFWGRVAYSAASYFDGSLDELALFNTSLTAAQVAKLYLLGKAWVRKHPFIASVSVANSGAPTHTSSGNDQKVGSGGGTATYTADIDVKPEGYTATQADTTNKRINIIHSGLYRIDGRITFASISDAKNVRCKIKKGGSTTVAGDFRTVGAASTPSVGCSNVVALLAGDYLELFAMQDDSASEAYDVASSWENNLTATYLGPTG